MGAGLVSDTAAFETALLKGHVSEMGRGSLNCFSLELTTTVIGLKLTLCLYIDRENSIVKPAGQVNKVDSLFLLLLKLKGLPN